MPAPVPDILRGAGARFALLFGSSARGTARPDSDLDIAAWCDEPAPASFDVLLPARVDLAVLNRARLAFAGPIACEGLPVLVEDQGA